ncbi:hypothetical protein F3Y22_tig00111022pilonHSYRG00268 [Hibiscus syriacus]|uniref:DRBM domain-containing protein n=1 Tax=Hibiscus syriacus TaxID=106335 RepID=A0A6A2Z6Z9_HIBSY|nr:hypothetical protein F3Y22_tig00111022pilonHSYRG00268 [Hibiscus syriacus]
MYKSKLQELCQQRQWELPRYSSMKVALVIILASNPLSPQRLLAESGMYKNLLQELTQREEWSLPDYKTTQCGEPHRPTFFSTVQVEGRLFHGKGGKSKKEAEINAAKLAYTNLTQHKSFSSLF